MSKFYAMMLANTDDLYQDQVWKNLSIRVSNSDSSVFFFCGGPLESPDGNERYSNIIFNLMKYLPMDGLITHSGILSYHCGKEYFDNYMKQFNTLPIVSLSMKQENCITVGLNNLESSIKLCRHLLDTHGYTKYAYITGPSENRESIDRLRGTIQVLKENNIEIPKKWLYAGNFTELSGYNGTLEILSANEKPEVIICSNDETAIGACDAIKSLGLRIPEDIAVVGFDDVESSKLLDIPLTTIRQPFDELVNQAFEILENNRSDDVELVGDLIVRESCGCHDETYVENCGYCHEKVYMTKYNDSLRQRYKMLYMTSRFSSITTKEQLKNVLTNYFESYGGTELYISLFHDFKMAIDNPLEFEYPDNLELFFGYCNGEFIEEKSFSSKDGLPDDVFSISKSRSFLIYPIVFDNITYGHIVSDAKTSEEMSFIAFKTQLTMVLKTIDTHNQLKENAKKLEDLSLRDSLTNLYNRRGFYKRSNERLKKQIAKGLTPSVIYCDINKLKPVNDVFGHSAGDNLIEHASEVLEKFFTKNEIISRVGGDEFVVFLNHLDEKKIGTICLELDNFVLESNKDFPYPYTLSMGSGVSRYSALKNHTLEELIDEADKNLYKKKRKYQR